MGFNRCFETLDRYINGIKQIFTGKVNASESLGSVISIGNTFPGVLELAEVLDFDSNFFNHFGIHDILVNSSI
jgi:hypothetical protein